MLTCLFLLSDIRILVTKNYSTLRIITFLFKLRKRNPNQYFTHPFILISLIWIKILMKKIRLKSYKKPKKRLVPEKTLKILDGFDLSKVYFYLITQLVIGSITNFIISVVTKIFI